MSRQPIGAARKQRKIGPMLEAKSNYQQLMAKVNQRIVFWILFSKYFR